MLVGESSGANKVGGCLEGVSPFAATVGAWQRLTAPHQPCVLGWWKPAWPPGDSPHRGHPFRDTLDHQNPSSSPLDARKTRHKTPRTAKQAPLDPIQAQAPTTQPNPYRDQPHSKCQLRIAASNPLPAPQTSPHHLHFKCTNQKAPTKGAELVSCRCARRGVGAASFPLWTCSADQLLSSSILFSWFLVRLRGSCRLSIT